MPVTFARLRIAGFKSFAEPVSVEILPGLTGIVGPNGCGKSNVVEALRWCMGESSARSLRGGEMDDLIFAGTAGRPARNLAEVVLTLEDAAGLAPPPLHDQAELQIGRRIERGAGSAYRINGREARARDVQTLFADLASGARSSAMVSQGRVAAIVGARPEERRSVLEEAAGITGLHARRHEAELKLRATEANLARAEDLRLQLEAQTKSLSGQAEQAARYRTVAEELRVREASLLAVLHARARRAVELTGAARIDAERNRIAAERALAEAAATEQHAAASLAQPREEEALARTLLERRRIEAEGAARDGERALQESEAADRRMAQARENCEAAEARLADAEREVERLGAEQAALSASRDTVPARLAEAERRGAEARAALEAAEAAYRHDEERWAAARTRAAEHKRDADAASSRLVRTETTLAEIDAELDRVRNDAPAATALASLEQALAAAQRALGDTETALDTAIGARGETARLAEAARLAAEDAARRHQAALDAEQDAAMRVERLGRECATLETRLADAENRLVPAELRAAADAAVKRAETVLADARRALEDAEQARGAAAAARMEAEGRSRDGARTRAQAEAERNRCAAALDRARNEHAQARRDHDAALAAALAEGVLSSAVDKREKAETALDAVKTSLETAEGAYSAAQSEHDAQSEALAALRERSARLAAEADGLAQALASGAEAGSRAWATLAESLEVPAGLERAVAAVLADGLDAGCVPEAPQRWRMLASLPAPALPGSAQPLSTLLAAPEPLSRALDHAGLLPDDADGQALQAALKPGECLVTRAGALWRWDGFSIDAGQPSAASIRLQQRARHRDTLAALAEVDSALSPAAEGLGEIARKRAALIERLQTLRQDRGAAEQALDAARQTENRLSSQEAQNRARLQATEPRRSRAEAALAEAEAARTAAMEALDTLPSKQDLAAAASGAARADAAAQETEARARRARVAADTALQEARAKAASLAAQHSAHETARGSLLPALDRLRDEMAAAETALIAARDALSAMAPDEARTIAIDADARANAASQAELAARTARDAARAALAARTAERDRIAALQRDTEARIAALSARRAAADLERAEANDAVAALEEAAKALPDLEAAAEATARSDAALSEARVADRTAADALGALQSEAISLEAREAPLRAAVADWTRRLAAARTEAEEAGARLLAAREEAQARRLDPDGETARRAAIEAALSGAAQQHADAIARLQAAEAAATEAATRRRDADTAFAAAREALLRAEGRAEQAAEILARLLADTPEPPTEVPADLTENAETALRRRIAALVRERDAMGPVNLRADLELNEATARMESIVREREEIETAIGRLRGQIGQLNREGRERLLAVFEQVDRYFQSLFARMFNGGRAHLGMVGSDDPLEAGLEIYAQPPGKKLATLSLLSGGEQALTALSLVFAVFRCNPAPICVLDEVDAPLDDANVERFCSLLGDMVREAGTRFLVVTHHQLTMAHMDRLYGVTMQERGVSRVLSVDLAAATAMVG
ncbi:AAA family ATPase [Acetobacteraceae bacterium KSS8]|uniref:Chromosome partition protein Smc n=1 Tax=Endosaccharibacter trunci TaxID=2812733 RepID=A0ABT1W620_9PROT|nr:AAA family ATPase [Acetobacteraceae bacterium KSS8]